MRLDSLVAAAAAAALALPLAAHADACYTGDMRHLVTMLMVQAADETLAGAAADPGDAVDGEESAVSSDGQTESDRIDRIDRDADARRAQSMVVVRVAAAPARSGPAPSRSRSHYGGRHHEHP